MAFINSSYEIFLRPVKAFIDDPRATCVNFRIHNEVICKVYFFFFFFFFLSPRATQTHNDFVDASRMFIGVETEDLVIAFRSMIKISLISLL